MTATTWLDDRFELTEVVGRGGHGRVWRARDHKLDRDVAVKDCPADAAHDEVQALRREITALAHVNSPYVVAIHDFILTGANLWLIMEYVRGGSLRDQLREQARPPNASLLRWIEQICRGLAAAHQRRIVHRDVKPANIMITDEGDAKLVDFGIAGFLGRPTTTPGVHLTACYAAPERWRGERGDARTDLYAVGCVLYEMLTGKPPFGSHQAPLVYLQRAHRSETVVPPGRLAPGIPPPLSRLALDLLQKDPDDRPGDARVVAERARAAAHSAPGAVPSRESGGLPASYDAPVGASDDFARRIENDARELARRLGPTHPETLKARMEHAEMTGQAGDAHGAAQLYRRLAQDYQKAFGRGSRGRLDAFQGESRWLSRAAEQAAQQE
ncbi:serine/threonine-protein kinase [Streptomonospora arabica]|uniref:non-specific serine/threonine protein kinase n=1 Tax=Streptomonospora arabica TaxID=412417 RepID=A0ABV9SGI2_9ACTN